MPDGTIRADAEKIASAVSVFRDAGDQVAFVRLDGVAEGLEPMARTADFSDGRDLARYILSEGRNYAPPEMRFRGESQ